MASVLPYVGALHVFFMVKLIEFACRCFLETWAPGRLASSSSSPRGSGTSDTSRPLGRRSSHRRCQITPSRSGTIASPPFSSAVQHPPPSSTISLAWTHCIAWKRMIVHP